jgi:hypothetical protein
MGMRFWLEKHICGPQTPHNFYQRLRRNCISDVVLPVFPGDRPADLASCERLSLHFQVHFRINICRVEREVTQPSADGVDVDACAQKMGRRRVANGMRAHPSARLRRHAGQGSFDVPFDHHVNPKAGDGPTTPIQEHVIGRRTPRYQ